MACFNPGGNGEDKGLGSMPPSLSCPFVDQIEALGHGSCPPMAPFAGPSYLSLMAGVAPVDAFHRPSASDPWCNVAYPINHFADNPAPLERGVEDDSFDADFSGSDEDDSYIQHCGDGLHIVDDNLPSSTLRTK